MSLTRQPVDSPRGFLCIPLFKFGVPSIPVWGPYISQVEELAPSFLLTLIVGVLATWIKTPSEARAEVYENASSTS